MNGPRARLRLQRERERGREKGTRTCGEYGRDYWCRVQFALGHAQETADVFAVLKHGRINDRIGDRLRCVMQIEQGLSIIILHISCAHWSWIWGCERELRVAETILRRARFWPWTATVAMGGGEDRGPAFVVSLVDVKELMREGICYFDSANAGAFSLFPHSLLQKQGR